MITIEINGQRLEGFEQISVSKNIETISGVFSFAATSNDVTTFPIERSDLCKVFINNDIVINGYVDTVAVTYDSSTHSISVTGRDRTSDVIDSTVVGSKEFIAPISLEQVIRTTLDSNGLTDIKIINQAGLVEPFKEGEFVSAEIGQTVFDFIESYARKRQVLLTTNGNGDIVLARSGTTQAIVTLLNKLNGQFNNIKSGSVTYSSNSLFNKYTLRSQQNPSAMAFSGDVTNENVVNQKGETFDKNIRESRQIEITADTSDNNVDLQNLAIWNKNIRKARSAEYSVVVQGFYQDNEQTRLWIPNELVRVDDDFADVNATLLIKSVSYNLSLTGTGSQTTLNLVDKNAYTIQAELDLVEARANEQGDNLIFGS